MLYNANSCNHITQRSLEYKALASGVLRTTDSATGLSSSTKRRPLRDSSMSSDVDAAAGALVALFDTLYVSRPPTMEVAC